MPGPAEAPSFNPLTTLTSPRFAPRSERTERNQYVCCDSAHRILAPSQFGNTCNAEYGEPAMNWTPPSRISFQPPCMGTISASYPCSFRKPSSTAAVALK